MKELIALLLAALVLTSCDQDELVIETKETETETEIESDTFTTETEAEPESMVVTEIITPPDPETEIIVMDPETEVQETKTEQSGQTQPDTIDTEPIVEETAPIIQETENIVDETAPVIDSVIEYPINYTDDTCEITITKEWYEDANVYASHIVFTEYDRLGTSCGFGAYNMGYETTTDAAVRIGSLLTVNGCHSASYPDKIVVRDGIVYNGGDKDLYLPAIYNSNTGLLMNASSAEQCEFFGRNVNELVDDGLFTDSFYFHFPFLIDGEIHCNLGNSRAQRTFIGTNEEAGDIWIIVSDGRWNDGISPGLTYDQCAAYLQSKGCKFGVALDGGGSTTMVWQGNVLNAVGEANQRAVVDFVYFK